jgi:hypothetical protein
MVVVGGGGTVITNPNITKTGAQAVLSASYPSSANVWTVVGEVVEGNLGASESVVVQAYAVCAL